MRRAKPLIGIDLGTTNSVVSVWENDQAVVIPNALGKNLTPSVVSIDGDGQILIGEAARDRLLSHPDLSVSAFKRRMGTNNEWSAAGRKFRPEELSALVIRQLLDDARVYTGEAITEAVVSVPAYFNDAQRRATRIAGELSGVQVERLINEPTAAAIAYGLHEQLDEARILVVDLGGGTLDVSVLEFYDGVMEVHASAGDNYLGGEDFEDLLATAFLEHCGLKSARLTSSESSHLRASVQRAKHQLSAAQEATISLQKGTLLGARNHEWNLTRADFERIAEPLLTRLRNTIERAVRDSKANATDLDQVVLVGGATRMPMVRMLVGRLFRKMPLTHINPDEIVAMGAAVQSALREGTGALEDVVLTDVCPYTLGINIAIEKENNRYESGHFLPIIERNCTVPVSRVERVYPIRSDQSALRCDIFQGESRRVENNVRLGSIEIEMPEQAPENGADVRFTYDVNGILEVLVEVVGTTTSRRLVVNSSDNGLSDAEIEAALTRIAALKIHPRDQIENRTVLARGERLYEESLGTQRQLIASLIQDFETVLESQDHTVVEAARDQFKQRLDEIEVDVFR